MSTSPAQIAANRANAFYSTGPRTEAGKAKVAFNAVKTGLTGRNIYLPPEEAAAYQALMLSYQEKFQPVGPIETGLVQSITDVVWRLDRIPGLLVALLNLGRAEISQTNPEIAANPDPLALDSHVYLRHEKQFRNLDLQENRLVRRRERELKELHALQKERQTPSAKPAESAPPATAEPISTNAAPEGKNGFEFSAEPAVLRKPAASALETPEMARRAAAD